MNINLTKEQMQFIVDCIVMAEGEGMYSSDKNREELDILEADILKLFGCTENQIRDVMRYCFSITI